MEANEYGHECPSINIAEMGIEDDALIGIEKIVKV